MKKNELEECNKEMKALLDEILKISQCRGSIMYAPEYYSGKLRKIREILELFESKA